MTTLVATITVAKRCDHENNCKGEILRSARIIREEWEGNSQMGGC